MPDARTKTELIRVGVPARLVTVRKFLEALDDVHPETMIRHHNGALIIEEPSASFPTDGDSADVDGAKEDLLAPTKPAA